MKMGPNKNVLSHSSKEKIKIADIRCKPFTGEDWQLHKTSEGRKERNKNESPYYCIKCKRVYSSKIGFERHIASHNVKKLKNNKCKICGKIFGYARNLKSHMISHEGVKPFSCDECGKKFSYKSALNIHMKIHTGEKPYSCEHCEMSFIQNRDLQRHVRNHLGVKLFSCSDCGKQISRRSNLRLHMMRHTGEKQFSCPLCGKEFVGKKNLEAHAKTHIQSVLSNRK